MVSTIAMAGGDRPASRHHHCCCCSYSPLLLPLLAEFGNPLFQAPGMSPSPGLLNPVFSPATLGTAAPPSSAAGLRRLGFLPPSQLRGNAEAAALSPGSGDEAMAEDEYGEGGDGQPPAASLTGVSPAGGGAGTGRERPEEEEFAAVLGAGGVALNSRLMWGWVLDCRARSQAGTCAQCRPVPPCHVAATPRPARRSDARRGRRGRGREGVCDHLPPPCRRPAGAGLIAAAARCQVGAPGRGWQSAQAVAALRASEKRRDPELGSELELAPLLR